MCIYVYHLFCICSAHQGSWSVQLNIQTHASHKPRGTRLLSRTGTVTSCWEVSGTPARILVVVQGMASDSATRDDSSGAMRGCLPQAGVVLAGA